MADIYDICNSEEDAEMMRRNVMSKASPVAREIERRHRAKKEAVAGIPEKDFITLEDGFFYYFPDETGAYSSHLLREIADELDKRNVKWSAVALETLTRRIAELEAALKPFADAADHWIGPDKASIVGGPCTLGYLRAARAALDKTPEGWSHKNDGWR